MFKITHKRIYHIVFITVWSVVTGFAQVTTIVNYDFNSGSSFGALTPSLSSNISCAPSSTETFSVSSGTITGVNAFTTNSTAGNALTMANSSGTNTRYFTFRLGGVELPLHHTYKVYFQAHRASTGASTITLAYSTDGVSFSNVSVPQTSGNGSFNQCSYDLSAISAINMKSAIYFRLLVSGASGTGSLRIDNFQVRATKCTTLANVSAGSNQIITCSNPSAVLTGSSSTSGVTYSWSPGGATTASLSVASAGTYTLKVTDPSNGCTNTMTTAVTSNTTPPGLAISSIPTTSLLAYWPFDGNANDLSGNGNNGTVTSASLTADRFGNPNRAYYFNGTTSRIDVPNSTTVDMTAGNDYTMSFWLKTNAGNGFTLPISKAPLGGGNTGYHFFVNNTNTSYCNGPGQFAYYVAASTNGDACANNLISNDAANWYFITGKYKSSTNETFLYVNGVLQSDIGSAAGPLSNIAPLTFGACGCGAYQYYNGYLDDIRFYKRLLTQNEINALYIEPNPIITCSNPSITLRGISPTSGVTYSWSPGGATTSSITVTTGGVYTVQVTDPATGCVGASTVAVNSYNPIADAGADMYIVVGTTDILGGMPAASGGSGNYSYSWQPAITYTPANSVSNPLVDASAAVAYTLTVTDNETGCTDADKVLVHVVSDPYFFTLKKQLDGGYYISYNDKIYFSFEEEYFDSAQGSSNSLSYTIVTDKNALISSPPGLIEVIGDNKFTINLSTIGGLMVQGEYYRIAITNKKNEVFYARFKY